MPKQELPNADAFRLFERQLIIRGFRRVTTREFKTDWWRLQLEAPREREGREVGFTYHAHGLTVVVWTTYLEQQGPARNEDQGWVLIKDGDEVLYTSYPMNRTKNYLDTLLMTAQKARFRVKNRPLCPQCHAYMNIVRGKGLKSRHWQCKKPAAHKKAVNLSWDHGLPKEALEFDKPIRKARARYRNELRRQGKKPGAALRNRRPWKAHNKDNVLPAR